MRKPLTIFASMESVKKKITETSVPINNGFKHSHQRQKQYPFKALEAFFV